MRITRSLAKLERLLTAFDAYSRLDLADDGTVESAKRIIRAQNVLVDTCIECGMDPGASEFEFAPRLIGRFLVAA
jgi:hypothetical protein